MAHQVRQRLTPGQAGDSGRAEPLRDRWFRDQRRQEQTLRTRIEHLYRHRRLQRQEAELHWHPDPDLFAEGNLRHWGVSRGYLATVGFGAGAVGGAGLDALTLGASLGAAALVGGLIGAAGSYLAGDRLRLPVLQLGPLRQGCAPPASGRCRIPSSVTWYWVGGGPLVAREPAQSRRPGSADAGAGGPALADGAGSRQSPGHSPGLRTARRAAAAGAPAARRPGGRDRTGHGGLRGLAVEPHLIRMFILLGYSITP